MAAPAAVQQRMLFHSVESGGALDAVEIAPHGLQVTHIDALSHAFHGGRAYPGRPAADALSHDGLRFGDVAALAGGIVTRGILADVPRARGIDRLEPGERVTAADIGDALEFAAVPAQPGDALIVRTGIELQSEEDRTSTSLRTGLDATSVRWMREHDIAIYAGDCVESAPLEDPDENPLHGVGLVSMGLVLIDAPTVERLADACHEAGRREFLFVCGALPIAGGTGSAVNPLAIL
jgi:kynurenine formamidase